MESIVLHLQYIVLIWQTEEAEKNVLQSEYV